MEWKRTERIGVPRKDWEDFKSPAVYRCANEFFEGMGQNVFAEANFDSQFPITAGAHPFVITGCWFCVMTTRSPDAVLAINSRSDAWACSMLTVISLALNVTIIRYRVPE